MYHLLQNMEFFLLTGFGISTTSFKNNEDPLLPGQGMLQGSSSATPLYNICTDVSLATYNRMAHGAAFTHPHNGQQLIDHATQYVDDKTEMINLQGIHTPLPRNPNPTFIRTSLFQAASENSKIWSTLLWLSGGKLNSSKCFYYCIHPRYNFKRQTTAYLTEKRAPGNILLLNPATNTTAPIERLAPSSARRTWGLSWRLTDPANSKSNHLYSKLQPSLGK